MDLSGLVFTHETHPLLIQIAHAYKATPVPEKEFLKELSGDNDPYQLDGHVNIRDLCKDIGVDYDERVKTDKETKEDKETTTSEVV